MAVRAQVVVRGIVQGVGFRPFVYRLAQQHALTGWVLNSTQGVVIEVEGPKGSIEGFIAHLTAEPPPQALIERVESNFLPPVGYSSFVIKASRAQALDEANRFKDEFLASISHQLLTPITSIKAAADLLLVSAAGSDGPAVSLTKSISRNTQRLQALVEELLDLTRLHRGEASLSRQPWDLRVIVEEALAAVEPLAEEKDQTLDMGVPSSPCSVLADRGRLEQALMNLLSNSCKFTPRHGHVAVALREDGDAYIVSVSDTGPGIPLEEQPHIFERFYSRSRGPGRKAGSGLGLAIAKTVVELHGGRIWVRSQSGRGSTFYFTVPKENRHEDTRRR